MEWLSLSSGALVECLVLLILVWLWGVSGCGSCSPCCCCVGGMESRQAFLISIVLAIIDDMRMSRHDEEEELGAMAG